MYSNRRSLAPSGFSRRSFFRFAAGASALVTLPILTEPHLALAARPHFADPNKGIHIDANENPMGPSDAARQAMVNIIPRGGRYLFTGEEELAEIFAKQEGLEPRVGHSLRRIIGTAALHRPRLYRQRQATCYCRPRI